MLEYFEKVGFIFIASSIKRWPTLPTPKDKMSAEFRSLSIEDLEIYQFDVILR